MRIKHQAGLAKALVVPAALALVTAACTRAPRPAVTAGDGSVIEVSLTEFKITPAKTLPLDRAFKMVAHNNGSAVHSMAIDIDGATIATPTLAAGEAATLAVPALKAGTYTLWCTVSGHREAGMETTVTPGATADAAAMSAEEMDRLHEAGVKAFPAKTSAVGGQVLRPRVVGGVKVFDLAVRPVVWEVTPGRFIEGYAYNGQIPGPEIRVRQADRVRFVVRNDLPESTAVHFHGVAVPNSMDGVPYITQPPIKPGKTFTYEFTVTEPPGSYMYHSHHNALSQVGKGLLGAFIVEPERRTWDIEHTLILGDGELGYTLNGKGFPATAPIVPAQGQRVLVRFMNAGQQLHPMHLHGVHFVVVARDGRPVTPYEIDTLTVAPGERYDAIFTASLPGVWAFHCHILSHVESEHGMHGMVTAVVVK